MLRTSGLVIVVTAKFKCGVKRNAPAGVVPNHETVLKGSHTSQIIQQEAILNILYDRILGRICEGYMLIEHATIT